MTVSAMTRRLILCLAAVPAGLGLLGLEVSGQTEQPISISEKALGRIRNPSGAMPDDINREISGVLKRYFGAAVAAVMGSEAETKYNAVTTYASMFGERNAFMNRLEIVGNMKIPGVGAYPAVVSLYIYFYTNDRLSGPFGTAAEYRRNAIARAVEEDERARRAARENNRPYRPRVLRLGTFIALPAQGNGWSWSTGDGRMTIEIRTLSDGVNPELIRGKAETLHAQLEGAGLYNFLSRLSAGGGAPPDPGIPEAAPGDCGKGAALTRHLEALRRQHRNLQTLDGELEWLLTGGSPDSGDVVAYGRKAERVAAEYHAVFRDFMRAETRRGLIEELDLLVETAILLNQIVDKYQHLAGVPLTPLKPEDLGGIRGKSSSAILRLAREYVASRLESEGLRDILTSESWDEAVEKAGGHVKRKVEEFVDGETARMFGFGFHDVESARRALRLQLRREIRRQVAKLLVKITSNEIVIEIVAGPVIRWIERELIPRLKEALRQKGNLPNRVARSVETMESARRGLNALPCDAKLREVRSRLAAARGALHAARFLDKDLRNAGEAAAPEFVKFVDGLSSLARTIHLAETRFLLTMDDYEDDLVLIDEVIGILRDILKRSVTSGTAVRPPAERKPPADKAAPVRLRHEEREEPATFASVSPKLKTLRFYEGGIEGVKDGFRDYRAAFPKDTSRLIWWEVHFEYAAPGRRIDFSVEAVYYAPDGREMSRHSQAFFFEPDWTASAHSKGFGYRDGGGWPPGIYRVELFVDGTKTAEGKFHIIE